MSMLATWFIRIDIHLHMHQGIHITAYCVWDEKWELRCFFWLRCLVIVHSIHIYFGDLVTRVMQLPRLYTWFSRYLYIYSCFEKTKKIFFCFWKGFCKYFTWKLSQDPTRPYGKPMDLKGLLYMLNTTGIPMKVN